MTKKGKAEKIKEELYMLSVVIIGRNEEERLNELFSSLPAGEFFEWIYVDSDSSDRSVEIALSHGAKVFKVEKDSVYGPGTGRYIGTKEAYGRWVLYLDGDMAFREEFRPFMEKVIFEKDLPAASVGFAGRTLNRYLDQGGAIVAERDYAVLTRAETGPAESWGRPVNYHGGAVLYRRDKLLEAGSWNPAVYQLEEVDLLSRIVSRGGIVRAVDLPMADHYTPWLGTWEKLKLNFLPQWRGKKLYGAGQVVAARLKEGGFLSFVRCYPYPFVVLAGLMTVPFLYLLWPPLPLLLNLAIAAWLAIFKRWYFYLVYLGNLLQIMRGLLRYRPFEPRYRRVKKGPF